MTGMIDAPMPVGIAALITDIADLHSPVRRRNRLQDLTPPLGLIAALATPA